MQVNFVLTSKRYFKREVQRKVCFLVIDFVWKLFSQTGNIETYLLMKELENDYNELPDEGSSAANLDNLPVDTNL